MTKEKMTPGVRDKKSSKMDALVEEIDRSLAIVGDADVDWQRHLVDAYRSLHEQEFATSITRIAIALIQAKLDETAKKQEGS